MWDLYLFIIWVAYSVLFSNLPQPFAPFSSFRRLTTALENLEFPLDIKESMFLLPGMHGLLGVISHYD